MACEKCGNHEDKEICKGCNICKKQIHIMKWGLNWKTKESDEPCPQVCKFQLPNKQWITYKCHKKEGHELVCDFQVDKQMLERLARDSVGGR